MPQPGMHLQRPLGMQTPLIVSDAPVQSAVDLQAVARDSPGWSSSRRRTVQCSGGQLGGTSVQPHSSAPSDVHADELACAGHDGAGMTTPCGVSWHGAAARWPATSAAATREQVVGILTMSLRGN
jgi:hypothetical protein